jgi:hypothetical protein
MTQALEDPTRCLPEGPECFSYSSVISGNSYILSQDPTFSIVCNKVGIPKTVSCPQGTTEWRAGSCYLDCPPNMVENGLSCLWRTTGRIQSTPSCKNWLFWFDGTTCVPNPFSFLLIVSTFAVFLYLATRHSRTVK